MPLRLHHIIVGLFALALPVLNAQQEPAPMTEGDEFDALLAEADSILGQLDSSEQSPPDKLGWDHFAIGSIRTGAGLSSNFLKRAIPESSAYLQVEMDAFLAWATDTTQISSLFLVESSVYDYDLEPSNEAFAIVQLAAQLSQGVFDYGTKLTTSYGSLIYDSSLTTISVPSGTRIRQFIPSVLLYVDWYATDFNRFRLGLTGERAEFNIEGQDYWNPKLTVEWEHVWHPALTTLTTAGASRQIYDEDVARRPDGEPISPFAALKVNQLVLTQKLIWDPATWEWLSMTLTAGSAREKESLGKYETLRKSWVTTALKINNKWGQFRFIGHWGEYRYTYRQVSSSAALPNLQTQTSLTAEFSRTLPWRNIGIVARMQWNALNSRIREDSYSERRGELLLEWDY